MAFYLYIALALAAIALSLWLYLRRHSVHAWGREIQIARALELFALQHERLESLFLKAASATGKPRGLRWVKCTFESELLLAREKQTRQLVGFVPVTISFEAIEGGEMEGVAAVGNLRNATAVFAFISGEWQTAGKTVFNLNPPEVLERFQKEYEPVHPAGSHARILSANGQKSSE
jgi:hypothetical protein